LSEGAAQQLTPLVARDDDHGQLRLDILLAEAGLPDKRLPRRVGGWRTRSENVTRAWICGPNR